MKVIEFIGLPGSGKSTLCDLLEEELKQEGYRVLNFHVVFSHEELIQKVKIKINNGLAKQSRINKEFEKEVRALNLSDQIDIEEWIHIIKIMNYRIHKEAKRYDFILMDEGPLQAITALFHGKDIDDKKDISNLISSLSSEYLKNIEVIQLDLGMDTVCERLRNRNRDEDDFVDKDDTVMKSLLRQKDRNIRLVSDASDFNVNHISGDGETSDCMIKNILKFIL